MRAIAGVLATEGVPTSNAPSGPTDDTTLPLLVANTSTVGVISVTVTRSCALAAAPLSDKARNPSASTAAYRWQ